MYDLDHMLNGKGSRQHLQQMIKQAEREQLARQVKPVKKASPARALLAAISNLMAR
jgi:hypothetical protein